MADAPLDWLGAGRAVLAQQPFSVLLQAELTALSPRQCELQLPVTPQLLQQHGFVHGSVLGYLADNALIYAGGSALGVPVVTSEFKINYLRPAVGERLIVSARTEHQSRTQGVCRCEVFVVNAGVEKPCALAQGTLAVLLPKS